MRSSRIILLYLRSASTNDHIGICTTANMCNLSKQFQRRQFIINLLSYALFPMTFTLLQSWSLDNMFLCIIWWFLVNLFPLVCFSPFLALGRCSDHFLVHLNNIDILDISFISIKVSNNKYFQEFVIGSDFIFVYFVLLQNWNYPDAVGLGNLFNLPLIYKPDFWKEDGRVEFVSHLENRTSLIATIRVAVKLRYVMEEMWSGRGLAPGIPGKPTSTSISI